MIFEMSQVPFTDNVAQRTENQEEAIQAEIRLLICEFRDLN